MINDHIDLTHIKDHFINKLHRIAAEHNRYFSLINLAAHNQNVDSQGVGFTSPGYTGMLNQTPNFSCADVFHFDLGRLVWRLIRFFD